MTTEIEFDTPDDDLHDEEMGLWAFYALNGGKELKARLHDMKGNPSLIAKMRIVAKSILKESDVQGEIVSVLNGFLINTDRH